MVRTNLAFEYNTENLLCVCSIYYDYYYFFVSNKGKKKLFKSMDKGLYHLALQKLHNVRILLGHPFLLQVYMLLLRKQTKDESGTASSVDQHEEE